ncbi:MAG: c-type cytochrome [Sulfuricaulis sp.]
MKPFKLDSLLAIGSIVVLLMPLAHAAEPQDIIKYRQNMMKAIGGHTAAAGAIVQGKVDYKNQLVEHARALQALTNDIPALFPKGSDFGDTKAKDAVWSNRTEFEQRAKNAKDKVAGFAEAIQGGNQRAIVTSFKELGESCKACHKDFRKRED